MRVKFNSTHNKDIIVAFFFIIITIFGMIFEIPQNILFFIVLMISIILIGHPLICILFPYKKKDTAIVDFASLRDVNRNSSNLERLGLTLFASFAISASIMFFVVVYIDPTGLIYPYYLCTIYLIISLINFSIQSGIEEGNRPIYEIDYTLNIYDDFNSEGKVFLFILTLVSAVFIYSLPMIFDSNQSESYSEFFIMNSDFTSEDLITVTLEGESNNLFFIVTNFEGEDTSYEVVVNHHFYGEINETTDTYDYLISSEEMYSSNFVIEDGGEEYVESYFFNLEQGVWKIEFLLYKNSDDINYDIYREAYLWINVV